MKVQVTLVNHRGIVQAVCLTLSTKTFDEAIFEVTRMRFIIDGTTCYPIDNGTYKIDNIALVR